MTALPILYSFRRCPYAMRARMALLVSGTVCELREVKLSDKPAELIEISPKATVPVLLTPDGRVIEQSIDIMRWALAQDDPENWLATADDPLIAANDGPFKYHLDRYKYPNRHEGDAGGAVDHPVDHRAAATELLGPLEARVSGSRSFVDIAIMPFVRQFANTDRVYFDSLQLPKIQHWLAAHIASPLFETAMFTPPRWCKGDALPTYLTAESVAPISATDSR